MKGPSDRGGEGKWMTEKQLKDCWRTISEERQIPPESKINKYWKIKSIWNFDGLNKGKKWKKRPKCSFYLYMSDGVDVTDHHVKEKQEEKF